MSTINMSAVTIALKNEGTKAELWNTGGGVMCIYAGPKRKDDSGNERWAALLGPGFCEGGEFLLDLGEMYLGTDDEGEADPLSLHEWGVRTVEQLVALVIEQTRQEAGTVMPLSRMQDVLEDLQIKDGTHRDFT